MDTQELVRILAACILRADYLDQQDRRCRETPLAGYTHEIYWYTREAAFEFLKKSSYLNSIPPTWGNILVGVQDLRFWNINEVIKLIPEDIWVQVAHPDVIISDVLNS